MSVRQTTTALAENIPEVPAEVHLESEFLFSVTWWSAVLAYGIGDGLSTWFLFLADGVQESNPVVLELWPFGFLAAKLAVLAIPVALAALAADRDHIAFRYPPAVFAAILAILGGYATLHNTLLF